MRRRRRLLGSAALLSLTLAGCHLILGLGGADELAPGADAGAESSVSPACTAYCDRITTSCTGDDRQYQNDEHCHVFCAQLEERGGEPFACRVSSLEDSASAACFSAGPLGIGPLVCEDDPCELYCDLMSAACADTSLEPGQAGPTGGERSACVALCDRLEMVERFSVPERVLLTGNNLNCRIQHLNVALTFPAGNRSREEHCLHAAGQGAGRPCASESTGVDHQGAH